MSPKAKFNGYVLTIATVAIFYGCTWINKIPTISEVEKIILGVATSFSCYKIIVEAALFLANRITIFKRFILGGCYVEGTWVGYYVNPEGKPRFFVESFYQDMESLTIVGKSNNENHKQHATWTSVSPNIDLIRGKLVYMYDVEAINDDANNNGISVFYFERDGVDQPPKRLHGFWTDLNIGKRIRTREKKFSNKLSIDHATAMMASVELYEESEQKHQ